MNNTIYSELLFLVVDDDETFALVLKRALERRNLKVVTANTAEEALHHQSTNQLTHAIVDLKLEASSGLHLIPQLIERQPDLKIVMLTGYSSISTAVEAIKLGATNYLCKPADADEILLAFDKQTADPDTEIPENPPSVDRLEWEHIQKVLQQHEGNISATARALGMHRRTLQRKLQKRPVKR